jgi:hypothetical protein
MPTIDASDREIIPELLAAMRDAEYPPQFIYAYKKTGYIVLSDFWGQTLPEGAEEMWNAAVQEYFLLEWQASGWQAN